jgi:hypothetical protein
MGDCIVLVSCEKVPKNDMVENGLMDWDTTMITLGPSIWAPW